MTEKLPFALTDRYEVVEELGRGGHAVVYRAHDRTIRRDVAIKLLRSDALSDELRARFQQEIELTARLEHEHILHVYDTGEFAGRPFVVMELATNRTLADRLAAERQLPVGEALALTRQVGIALAHAHAHGVIHRDVKPENILLGADGAILADFGIARITQDTAIRGLTSTGVVVGTVLYMSPEQLCAEKTLDARSDQYALACVLYEMLAGVRPHVATTVEGLRLLRISGQHAAVSAHRPATPDAVEAALMRALSPMPADRFRSIDAFLVALGVLATDEFVTGPLHHAAHGRSARHPAHATSASSRVRPRRSFVGLIAWSAPVAASMLALFAWSRVNRTKTWPRSAATDGLVIGLQLDDRLGANASSVGGRVGSALRSELGQWPAVVVSAGRPASEQTPRVALSTLAQGDSTLVRMVVRQPRTGQSVVFDTTIAAPSATAAQELARRLARFALLTVVSSDDASDLSDPGILHNDSRLSSDQARGVRTLHDRSVDALREYARGFQRLRDGALDSASASFRLAGSASTTFGAAHLWAAQSAYWARPTKTFAWARSVELAQRSGTLRGEDSLLAAGLAGMSRMEFQDACRQFDAATNVNAQSFAAWYGAGECRRLDSLVISRGTVLDFRSSHWDAMTKYRRAVALAPTPPLLATLFPVIMRTTYAFAGRVRLGRRAGSRVAEYQALPSLSADTLAFHPVSFDEMRRMGSTSVPATLQPAVRRGAAVALELTQQWIERSPEYAPAWFHHAVALELSGRFTSVRGELSADSALARAAAVDRAGRLHTAIAIARTRNALRRGDLDSAVRLARAATSEMRTATLTPGQRDSLAPLAALVGDLPRALALSASDESNAQLSPVLAQARRDFRLRAVLGMCDGLGEAKESLVRAFAAAVAPAERAKQQQQWIRPVLRAAVPCLGPSVIGDGAPDGPLETAYQALASGDQRVARRTLRDLQTRRSGATASLLTWDWLFPESGALVQAGDSVGAKMRLIEALADIGSLNYFTLDETAQAAGLRRGILLLRDLVMRTGARVGSLEGQWVERAAALQVTTTPESR